MIEPIKDFVARWGTVWVLWLLFALCIMCVTIMVERGGLCWSQQDDVAAQVGELDDLLFIVDEGDAGARYFLPRSH